MEGGSGIVALVLIAGALIGAWQQAGEGSRLGVAFCLAFAAGFAYLLIDALG
jgi:hypothetical protein